MFIINLYRFTYDFEKNQRTLHWKRNCGPFSTEQEIHNLLHRLGFWSKGEPIKKYEGVIWEEYDFREKDGSVLHAKIEEYIPMIDVTELIEKTRI